jgi:hypothetical protein
MINAGKTYLGKKKISTIVWAIYEARTDTWFKHWLSSEGLGCITGIKPPCPSEEYDAHSKQGLVPISCTHGKICFFEAEVLQCIFMNPEIFLIININQSISSKFRNPKKKIRNFFFEISD